MARDLRGASVLITGASAGIGKAAALAFAREGARLLLAARRRDRLEEVAATARALGGAGLGAETDGGGRGSSVYCATKCARGGMSEALRVELRGSGIEVSVICPVSTASEFFEASSARSKRDHPPVGAIPTAGEGG